MLGLNHSRFAQHIGSDVRLTERNEPFQADDVVFLTENIREATLGHAAMQWHLAAFKSAHHARSAARALAFVPSGRRLAHPRTHATPHALLVFRRLLRCSNIRKIHKQALSCQHLTGQSQPDAAPWPPYRESRAYRVAQSLDSGA